MTTTPETVVTLRDALLNALCDNGHFGRLRTRDDLPYYKRVMAFMVRAFGVMEVVFERGVIVVTVPSMYIPLRRIWIDPKMSFMVGMKPIPKIDDRHHDIGATSRDPMGLWYAQLSQRPAIGRPVECLQIEIGCLDIHTSSLEGVSEVDACLIAVSDLIPYYILRAMRFALARV